MNNNMKLNLKNNKTKIVCTIGPACDNLKTLKAMAEFGMNYARINMSHGDETYYNKIANNIRKLKGVKIMTDTKGPEIRVGKLSNPLTIKEGSTITIFTKSKKAQGYSFFVYDSTGKYNMAKDLKKGNRILVDDGKLQLVASSVDATKGIVKAKALNTHTIVTNKRLNLPDSHYTMPFLSQQDKQSIINSIKLKADSIALSFVNTDKDILDVRKILKANKGNKIKLIAKIETQQALDNIEKIIKAADGIMVARGDLGLETPYYLIPAQEIRIVSLCKKAKKPVIVATQMLDSLEKGLQPTRAEVTDVFFAVVLGADATMLSGETANGKYPINAVKTMATINAATENILANCIINK